MNDYVNDIVDVVCVNMGITVCDFWENKDSLREPYTIARQITMFTLKKRHGLTTKEIGRIFNKDHSTVVYACKMINGYLQYDKEIRNIVSQVEEGLPKNILTFIKKKIQYKLDNNLPFEIELINEYNKKIKGSLL